MKKTPPNQYRIKEMGMWSSTYKDGMNGVFQIPLVVDGIPHPVTANCVVSDGTCLEGTGIETWEHVSVHIDDWGNQRTPSWGEMCLVKDVFWDPEECVVQFHPPKSDYVNNHPHVLHLWKLKNGKFPRPDFRMVGIKGLEAKLMEKPDAPHRVVPDGRLALAHRTWLSRAPVPAAANGSHRS